MAMKFAVGGEEGENIFSDVDEDDWFYDAVVNSIQYGWIRSATATAPSVPTTPSPARK